MRKNNSADRRIFARIPVSLPIRFLASSMDKECKGQTLDVSANGVRLESQEKLSPNTALEMWLELPESRDSFFPAPRLQLRQSSLFQPDTLPCQNTTFPKRRSHLLLSNTALPISPSVRE